MATINDDYPPQISSEGGFIRVTIHSVGLELIQLVFAFNWLHYDWWLIPPGTHDLFPVI